MTKAELLAKIEEARLRECKQFAEIVALRQEIKYRKNDLKRIEHEFRELYKLYTLQQNALFVL